MRPNENNLGGAREINDQYLNMARKIAGAKSSIAAIRESRDSLASTRFSSRQKASEATLAERLSSNRHHRRQNTDHVADTHLRNVYHMSRRIENMYSVTERKKNIFDTSIYPVCIRRPQQNDVCRSVSQWKPQQRNGQRGPSSPSRPAPAPRPQTAPAVPSSFPEDYHLTSSYGPIIANVANSDHLRGSKARDRFQKAAETDYITFKRAIENEIVENRITSERGLKRLFRDYLKHNDVEYRPVLRKVIADLKIEWDVA